MRPAVMSDADAAAAAAQPRRRRGRRRSRLLATELVEPPPPTTTNAVADYGWQRAAPGSCLSPIDGSFGPRTGCSQLCSRPTETQTTPTSYGKVTRDGRQSSWALESDCWRLLAFADRQIKTCREVAANNNKRASRYNNNNNNNRRAKIEPSSLAAAVAAAPAPNGSCCCCCCCVASTVVSGRQLLPWSCRRRLPMVAAIIITMLLGGSFIQAGEAVDCFKCSSRNGSNPACEDPFHNLNTTRIQTPILPDPQPHVIYHTPCYAGRKGKEGLFPASACIKLTGTFEATGETLVVRHCALDSGTLTQDTELARMSHCGKFQFEGDLLRGCVLACPEDACNSAVSRSAAGASIQTAVLAVALGRVLVGALQSHRI